MDEPGSRGSDLDFDLESGDTESSDEEVHEESSSDGKRPRKTMARARSGYLYVDGSIAASDGLSTSKNVSSIGENMDMLGSSTGKMTEGGVENRMGDKQKKKIPKKHPKPPRPPTGPALHAADIELVNEISKRARLRRARRERMNALKRMKADKTSSSKINFLAMVVTAIFFFVIIFQELQIPVYSYFITSLFRNLGFSCMNYVFINPTVQTTPSASATHRLALSLQGGVVQRQEEAYEIIVATFIFLSHGL